VLEQFDDLLVKILLLAAIISFVSIPSIISRPGLDTHRAHNYNLPEEPAADTLFALRLSFDFSFHGPLDTILNYVTCPRTENNKKEKDRRDEMKTKIRGEPDAREIFSIYFKILEYLLICLLSSSRARSFVDVSKTHSSLLTDGWLRGEQADRRVFAFLPLAPSNNTFCSAEKPKRAKLQFRLQSECGGLSRQNWENPMRSCLKSVGERREDIFRMFIFVK
jgi:hypothetical protein